MAKQLKDLVIKEVSLVDDGANPGARVLLCKRKEDKTSGGVSPHDEASFIKRIIEGLRKALHEDGPTNIDPSRRQADMLKQGPKKTEDGKAYPASDFAYVPDAEKPSTWKLRLTSEPGGDPDTRIVGAALAALGPGFRGQRVQIPAADLPGVKTKVKNAWLKAHPDKTAADLPTILKRGDNMADEDLKATVAELEKANAELTKQLETERGQVAKRDSIAKFRSELPDAMRTAFDGLNDSDRETFMTDYAKANTGDSPLAKALDAMAKRDSETQAKLAKMQAKHDREELLKGNLAVIAKVNTEEDSIALADAVIKLRAADAEAADLVVKQLTALATQAEVGGLFKTAGQSGGEGDASTKLEALAKARATEHKISYEKAYADVLAENPELYDSAATEEV